MFWWPARQNDGPKGGGLGGEANNVPNVSHNAECLQPGGLRCERLNGVREWARPLEAGVASLKERRNKTSCKWIGTPWSKATKIEIKKLWLLHPVALNATDAKVRGRGKVGGYCGGGWRERHEDKVGRLTIKQWNLFLTTFYLFSVFSTDTSKFVSSTIYIFHY